MNNAGNNKTDRERQMLHANEYIYWLWYKLESAMDGTRLWFRDPSDRRAFMDTFAGLNGRTLFQTGTMGRLQD